MHALRKHVNVPFENFFGLNPFILHTKPAKKKQILYFIHFNDIPDLFRPGRRILCDVSFEPQ